MEKYMENIRAEFPFFSYHPDLVYLDSAATTHKPREVIDAITQFYEKENANAMRGTYTLGNAVTRRINETRGMVTTFIHAHSPEEIVFTSGATDGMSKIALYWSLQNLKTGDEILVCKKDHASTVEPWTDLVERLKRFGVHIHVTYYDTWTQNAMDAEEVKKHCTEKTRLIVLTHIHNVFGSVNHIKEIRAAVGPEVLICLDASQSISHLPIDVQDLEIDFLVCSGHKMFAETGIGILWINKRVHTLLGDYGKGTPLQHIERGTLNIAGVISLGSAIQFIQRVGIANITAYIAHLTNTLLSELRTIDALEFLPSPAFSCAGGYGILSFKIPHIPSRDIGFILNEKGICVRTGSHCSANTNADDSVRISMHIYNTQNDIHSVVKALREISG